MKRIYYSFLVLMACVACQDDDSFSTDTSLQLTFSVDTLKLDTVFSRTPSSTYSFWVHNRNGEGIRLQQVRLRRGNQSGYRVNVDGIYLDNSNGSQTGDVEIRRNDSILVFVELTASETRQELPVELVDDLVFLLESGVEQWVCLQAWTWDAQKWYSPVISSDTLVDSRIPIVIYGDLTVSTGVRLEVRNTTLFFHDASGITVDGSLTLENCVLRGDRLDRMFTYLPYDRVSGQWRGIRLSSSSTDNRLTATEIRNPQYGIICDSAAIDTTRYRLNMERCIVHNCAGNGVETHYANIRLSDCQLSNTLGHCLSVDGGMANLNYCTLAQFYPFSADRGVALHFSNRHSPLMRLHGEGLILTGYEADVLQGEQSDEHLFEYFFNNCLLRTDSTSIDTSRCTQILYETPDDPTQGKQHFVKIDEDNLIYDFHLSASSPAQGMGCYR